MLQSFYGASLLLIGTVDADENAGVLHVLLHANFVGDDHAFEARVFEFSDKHGIDFVSDFFAHTQVTMIRWTHGNPVRRLQV
jgi:hypothetical protein